MQIQFGNKNFLLNFF